MKRLSNLKGIKMLKKTEQKSIIGSSQVLLDCSFGSDGHECVISKTYNFITHSWQYNFGICLNGECY
jgi:hypothetical protein